MGVADAKPRGGVYGEAETGSGLWGTWARLGSLHTSISLFCMTTYARWTLGLYSRKNRCWSLDFQRL